MHPMNLTIAIACAALWVIATSLGTYYILPPAGPGTTHVIDPGTGEWRRKAWVRVVAPFHQVGSGIVHHTPLPYRRISPAEARRFERDVRAWTEHGGR